MGKQTVVRARRAEVVVGRLVFEEIQRNHRHRPFDGLHHAWGVLAEEVDEVWDVVRERESARDRLALTRELVHVAAVAIRAAVELGAVECQACEGEGWLDHPDPEQSAGLGIRCKRCGGSGELSPEEAS